MNVQKFIARFHNHPIFFIGSGLSQRYVENSYNWEGLLKKAAIEIEPHEEYFLDLKAKYMKGNDIEYAKIATELESDFEIKLSKERYGRFKEINDLFYEKVRNNERVSRFKLYLAKLLKDVYIKESMQSEIIELKKARKNISSIITTNYDQMVEKLFSFNPLIGNDILLSNPYGSVYKIHGCVTHPEQIIITEEDYNNFEKKYELIRAQLLSLFVHNPIIFIGYKIGDRNIKEILKTIFSYVDYNSQEAEKIRDNFLLIEHDTGSDNQEVVEHDIDMGNRTIRINKVKTDDFITIYKSIARLILPVSAMDIRKVQNVVRDICEGNNDGDNIQVSITEDPDNLRNGDIVLAIGSKNTIKYFYATKTEMMMNYFQILEESNVQMLQLLNKQTIQKSQYFPIYAFSKVCPDLKNVDMLKKQQQEKIDTIIKNAHNGCKGIHCSPQSVLDDQNISRTYKVTEMICSIMDGNMDMDAVREYLEGYPDKSTTDYRKVLCAYDLRMNT